MKRVDHAPMYISIVCAIFVMSLGILFVHPLQDEEIVEDISMSVQEWLGVSMLVGTVMSLVGILLGTPLLFPKADIRLSYALMIYSSPSINVPMLVYLYALLSDWHEFQGERIFVILGMFCGICGTAWACGAELTRIRRNMRLIVVEPPIGFVQSPSDIPGEE